MGMELLITPMDMLTVMLAALYMAIHHIATITMARGKLTQKLSPTLDMPFLMDTHTLLDMLIPLDIPTHCMDILMATLMGMLISMDMERERQKQLLIQMLYLKLMRMLY